MLEISESLKVTGGAMRKNEGIKKNNKRDNGE